MSRDTIRSWFRSNPHCEAIWHARRDTMRPAEIAMTFAPRRAIVEKARIRFVDPADPRYTESTLELSSRLTGSVDADGVLFLFDGDRLLMKMRRIEGSRFGSPTPTAPLVEAALCAASLALFATVVALGSVAMGAA